jgi:hypothetical protein
MCRPDELGILVAVGGELICAHPVYSSGDTPYKTNRGWGGQENDFTGYGFLVALGAATEDELYAPVGQLLGVICHAGNGHIAWPSIHFILKRIEH